MINQNEMPLKRRILRIPSNKGWTHLSHSVLSETTLSGVIFFFFLVYLYGYSISHDPSTKYEHQNMCRYTHRTTTKKKWKFQPYIVVGMAGKGDPTHLHTLVPSSSSSAGRDLCLRIFAHTHTFWNWVYYTHHNFPSLPPLFSLVCVSF